MTPLRQRMIEDMQVLNLAPLTQSTYLLQVTLFARHFGKSPEQLTFEHVRDYQVRYGKRNWHPVRLWSPCRPSDSSTVGLFTRIGTSIR